MDHFLDLFHQTVRPYLQPELYVGTGKKFTEEDRDNIQLKINHTLRVLDEATALAEYAPDEHTGYLLRIAALFHDVGRFSQYKSYRTFKDADSVNHALESVRTLRRAEILSSLPVQDRVAVLIAVRTHNMFALPKNMSAQQEFLCKGVRDCDKLDIYPVMIGNFSGTANTSDVVCHSVNDEPDKYSQELYEQISSGQLGDYSKMKWKNDFKLLLVSWVYDLNFARTAQEIQNRGYLETIFSLLPDTPSINELHTTTAKYLDECSKGKRCV